ncbi:MAG: sensor histidine kinase [Bacteroidales bacterium]
MIRYLKTYQRIGTHVIFWITVVSTFVLFYGTYSKNYLGTLQTLLVTLPVDIGFTYFVLYFLIPRFLPKKKYFLFLLFFLVSNAVIVVLERALNLYIAEPMMWPKEMLKDIPFWHISIFSLAININIIVFLAASIKLLKYWYVTQQLKNELELQNKASELALLKSQISPHFLFNTLNNIHTLISKEAEMASDSVVKLSEIMRYMLYDANFERVPLQKEIDYLNSYIDLQKLRIKDPEVFQFTVNGEPDGLMIAPMLFIPFVENACKHGEKKNRTNGVDISLYIQGQQIKLKVVNTIASELMNSKDMTGGIGLRNVTRRLELLYPGSHDLIIRSEAGKFIVELEIQLS